MSKARCRWETIAPSTDTTSTRTEFDAECRGCRGTQHQPLVPGCGARLRNGAAMAYFLTDEPGTAAGKEQRKLATVEAVSLSAR
jgi:hypothetical protein